MAGSLAGVFRLALPTAVVAILVAVAMIVLVGGWVGVGAAGGCLAVAVGLMMWSDGRR